MDNKARGNEGEDVALHYLEDKGYEILERNFRNRRAEIDLIALWRNELLVFVEVKKRKDTSYGDPEAFALPGQQRLIIQAAEDYIFSINWHKDIRFDIIAVNDNNQIEHFEDAFY